MEIAEKAENPAVSEPVEGEQLSGPEIERANREMAIFGSAFGFFTALGGTSLLLKPLENYEKIAQLVNNSLPEVIRNQGADMATTSAVTLLSLVMFNRVFQISVAKEGLAPDRVQRATALFGIAVSLFYALEEASRIYDPSLNPESLVIRSFASGTPRGDWGDVLAYSTPLIAGVIYLAYDLGKTAYKKVKERAEQKRSVVSGQLAAAEVGS